MKKLRADAVSKSGWTRVAFGDVVRLSRERSSDPEEDGFDRYVGLEHIEPGNLQIRRWGNVAEGTTFTNVFRSGQVLFGKRRAYQRKVAVPDFDGVCSGDIYVFEPRNQQLLPELLPFVCQTDEFFQHAVGTSAGSLSPRTNWTSLAGYHFSLPPREEQRRIAAALVAVTNTQDYYGRAYRSLTMALDALVAKGMAELGRLTMPSTLQDHAEIRYGLTIDPKRRQANEHIQYLRVANVLRGSFDYAEIKTVGKMPGDAMYRLVLGDVLLVEGHASVDQIGRAAVWRDEHPEMFHQNHLIRVRCGSTLDPEYLCLLINSSHGRTYFRSRAKSTSGLSTINSTVVKQYAIPVPSRGAQKRIVDDVSRGDRLLQELSRRRLALTQVHRTVLDSLQRTQSMSSGAASPPDSAHA